MHRTVPRLHRSDKHWLRTLHCVYAGLFAFVLPLICWGAQATPGHPHARAHFVFVVPPLQANAALPPPVDADLATSDVSHHNSPDSARTAHHAAQEAAEKPVGRSVPSMLGFSLLLLIGLAVAGIWYYWM